MRDKYESTHNAVVDWFIHKFVRRGLSSFFEISKKLESKRRIWIPINLFELDCFELLFIFVFVLIFIFVFVLLFAFAP